MTVLVGCGDGNKSGGASQVRAWAVGRTVPSPGMPRHPIVLSDDGGRTWVVQATREEEVRGLHFVDRERGWAVGSNAILHSQDAGVSWVSQWENVMPLGSFATLWGVAFVSETQGVAVGSGGPPGTGCLGDCPAVILFTRNGGATWTIAPIASKALSGTALAGTLRDVCFTERGVGFAVGHAIESQEDLLLVSRDAGATWTDIEDPLGIGSAPPTAGACAGEADLWFTGVQAGRRWTLAHSPDGGRTWEDQSEAIPLGLYVHDLTFVTPRLGWAAVGRIPTSVPTIATGMVLHTVDSGRTWTMQEIVTPAQSILTLLAFADGAQGFAMGELLGNQLQGIAFGTVDGGARWEPGTLPSGFFDLTDLALVR